MDTLNNIRISGLALFAFASLLNLLSFIYRIIWSFHILKKHIKPKSTFKSIYVVKSLNFSIWGYFTLFSICLILTYLYAALWQMQGMALKPFGIIVNYGRWVAWSIIFGLGILYIYLQNENWYNKSFKTQGFYSVFWGVISMVTIIFATLTLTNSSKIFSMVSSMIAAFISLSLLFFPNNIFFELDFIFINHKSHHETIFHTGSHPKLIRTLFVIALILWYIANIIIWFFSESNEIVTSSLLDFTNEAIAYLVFDSLLIYFFTIYSMFSSYLHKPQFKIEYNNE